MGSPGGSDSKEPACKQGTLFLLAGQEDLLEKGMAAHSSISAWESHGNRSLVGYIPRSLKELEMTERLTHTRNSCFKLCKDEELTTVKSFELFLNDFDVEQQILYPCCCCCCC